MDWRRYLGMSRPGNGHSGDESDPGETTFRVQRQGHGRRHDDADLRELFGNQTARRIVTVGLAALMSIAGYAVGYVKGLGAENDALRANNMKLFQDRITDDTKQRIEEARSLALQAATTTAQNEQQIKALANETRSMSLALNRLTAELKKERLE